MSPDLKNNNPLEAENTDVQSQHPCNREVIQKQQIAFSGWDLAMNQVKITCPSSEHHFPFTK